MRKILLSLVLLLASCGGDDDDGQTTGDGGIVSSTCKITLSGAVTGTFSCIASAGKQDSEANGVMGLLVNDPTVTSLSVSFEVVGAPTARRYGAADLVGGGAALITKDATPRYFTATADTPPLGSIDHFTLTSVTMLSRSNDTDIFTIHGSFAATMAGQGGISSAVNISATF